MVKRIDFIMPHFSQYEVMHQMTRDVCEAMKRAGVTCRILVAEKQNPKGFFDALLMDKPDCTFSFNGILPDEHGRFLCDMIKIPHVACLVDSQNQFVPLIQSRLNIITCPDLYEVQFFKNLNFHNVLFFPHGVSKDIITDPKMDKKFDVVLLSSCIDYEAIRDSWNNKYPKKLIDAMEDTAQITLSEQYTPYVEAFTRGLNNHFSEHLDLDQFSKMQILDELEMYIRGKDRVALIRGIKDAKVDIFGEGGWGKYIGKDHPNIHLHSGVPFEKALEIMKESKIILSSCAWIKNGGHERIFAGISSGALVITSDNPYMVDHFENGKDIVFYYYGRWNEVNDIINDYLENEEERVAVVENGRKKVAANHTWDKRVVSLLNQLPAILKNIRTNQQI